MGLETDLRNNSNTIIKDIITSDALIFSLDQLTELSLSSFRIHAQTTVYFSPPPHPILWCFLVLRLWLGHLLARRAHHDWPLFLDAAYLQANISTELYSLIFISMCSFISQYRFVCFFL